MPRDSNYYAMMFVHLLSRNLEIFLICEARSAMCKKSAIVQRWICEQQIVNRNSKHSASVCY